MDTIDVTRCQLVSSRFLNLARDFELWKTLCFEDSRAEAARRRQRLRDAQDSHLNELVHAISSLPGVSSTSGVSSDTTESRTSDRIQRNRALANWEPGYPGEDIDYYEEYIHRHADVNVDWINLPNTGGGDKREVREATGMAILSNNGSQNIVSPLDDGTICVWDVAPRTTTLDGGRAKLLGQSNAGLLTGSASSDRSHTLMTEIGAVECVSIDSSTSKGYFAVQDVLQEVDLRTLQVSSTKKYPFPITALSSCQPGMPLSVGTSWTVHLHDSRDLSTPSGTDDTAQLIGGSVNAHAALSQPGPLSILNHHDPSSIWVAGRFTSLLNYDIRRFPRLLGTIHSGARIASLTSLPWPFIPRSLDLLRNADASLTALQTARSKPGTTLLAAASTRAKAHWSSTIHPERIATRIDKPLRHPSSCPLHLTAGGLCSLTAMATCDGWKEMALHSCANTTSTPRPAPMPRLVGYSHPRLLRCQVKATLCRRSYHFEHVRATSALNDQMCPAKR